MTRWKPSLLLKSHIVVMISTLAPIVITIILVKDVWNLIADENVITYGKYIYPSWGQWIGWSLALLSIVAIPCGAVEHMISGHVFTSGNIWEDLKSSLKPTKLWRQNAHLNSNIPPLNTYENNGFTDPL
jgi:hypothetical protein